MKEQPRLDIRKIIERMKAFDDLVIIIADGIKLTPELDQLCHKVIERLVVVLDFYGLFKQDLSRIIANAARGRVLEFALEFIELIRAEADA